MPKKKKYGRSRWYKPYIKASAPAVGYIAMQSAKQAVKSLMNVEYKYLDTQITHNPTNATAGSVTHVTNVLQGLTSDDRTGDSIKLVAIQIKWQASINTSASDGRTCMKVVLVRSVNRTTAPNWASGDNGSVYKSANVYPLRDRDNTKRYQVLWEKNIILNNSSSKQKVGEIYKTLKTHVQWEIGGDERNGQLYIMTVSDEATSGPAFRANCRITFLDN